VRERAATIDSAEFDNDGGVRGLLRRALGRSPLDAVALFVLLVAVGAILINALYRQPGPHPAPIFSVKVHSPRETTAKVAPAGDGTAGSPGQARPTYRVEPEMVSPMRPTGIKLFCGS